ANESRIRRGGGTLDKPKLTLNIRQPTDDSKAKEAVKAVTKRKAAANESIEDAWLRILAMKNSDADQRKLNEVKKAMEEGLIGREPSSAAKRFSKAEAIRLYTKLRERQREETLRKMVEETPANYQLITKESLLAQLVEELKTEKEVAVDTETTGVDVYTDVIVGMSITLPSIRRSEERRVG